MGATEQKVISHGCTRQGKETIQSLIDHSLQDFGTHFDVFFSPKSVLSTLKTGSRLLCGTCLRAEREPRPCLYEGKYLDSPRFFNLDCMLDPKTLIIIVVLIHPHFRCVHILTYISIGVYIEGNA